MEEAGVGASFVGSGVGGVLARVFPPGLVDEVIAGVGRTERRHRSLPARVMAYFAIGMALYSEGSYEDVLAQLTDGLSWASGWTQTYRAPSKSAIFQARARLGAEPVKALFERVARPIGTDATPGCGWLGGGWSRLMGCVWMWRTRSRTSSISVVPGSTRASGLRFLRPGWSRWPSVARTRCSPPRSEPMPNPRRCWLIV